MAGSISLSLSQQFDELGSPLSGGRLYFIQAGTTSTPQNAFYDSALTLPLPNPYTLNAAGRITAFYLADGQIKIRLTSATGVVQIEQDNLLVIGPSSGEGGGGGGVDPTTIIATGDIKTRYGTGSLTGFVRLNGRTIGSATSGATERSNSDAQALFEYLWLADANLAVSTGRGLTANADWVANKTIALPDGRGRVLAALDDMGNTAAGRLTASYFGAVATALGAAGGSESNTLTKSQLAAHDHGGATSSGGNVPGTVTGGTYGGLTNGLVASGSGSYVAYGGGSVVQPIAVTGGLHTHPIPSDGSGAAHNNTQPTLLVTNYIKL